MCYSLEVGQVRMPVAKRLENEWDQPEDKIVGKRPVVAEKNENRHCPHEVVNPLVTQEEHGETNHSDYARDNRVEDRRESKSQIRQNLGKANPSRDQGSPVRKVGSDCCAPPCGWGGYDERNVGS